jgi:hypothetical protein
MLIHSDPSLQRGGAGFSFFMGSIRAGRFFAVRVFSRSKSPPELMKKGETAIGICDFWESAIRI